PVAGGARADLKRHADAVAGVPAAAAHFGQIPAGAEITRAHFRIGFETAAGEHHGPRAPLMQAVIPGEAHAVDAAFLVDERARRGVVADLDAVLERGVGQHLDETRPAADRLHGEAAPELEPAVDLERLATVDRDQPDALCGHPLQRVE